MADSLQMYLVLLARGAVGGVTAFGCDLAELVLGEVGEVGGVGIGHVGVWSGLFGCGVKCWMVWETVWGLK